jgi:two-component system OmpR family response regulator
MTEPAGILLVDDDIMIRGCLSAYLEDEGYAIRTATTAEEALADLESFYPVVCITDMRLQGMSGEAFILKAHEICPASRFLIHTGGDYLLAKELCAIGMTPDDVLLKPVHDLTLLNARINAAARYGRTCHVPLP